MPRLRVNLCFAVAASVLLVGCQDAYVVSFMNGCEVPIDFRPLDSDESAFELLLPGEKSETWLFSNDVVQHDYVIRQEGEQVVHSFNVETLADFDGQSGTVRIEATECG